MSHQRRFTRTSRVGTWIALSRENMVRLIDFDDLIWDLKTSLVDSKVASCPFGGPLAFYSSGRFSSENGVNVVHLYNSRGASHPVTPSIRLEGIESVLFMCWNECNDHLIIVLNTGQTRFFNLKGEPNAAAVQIPVPLLCTSTGNGIAMIIDDRGYRLVLLECKENGEYRAISVDLPSTLEKEKMRVILAVPQQFSDTGYTEVFVPFVPGEKKSSVYHCVFHSNSRCYDLRVSIEGGAVVHMTLSPNALSIAFLVEDGTLYVASRSFEDITRLLNIDTDVIPTQLLWCGEKCIAYLHLARQFDEDFEFSTTLTVVSSQDPDQSDFLNDLPPDAYLVSECDGIRIFSSRLNQFLQVVPEPSRRVFSVGSRANSAMLLLAFDEFMCGNANSVKMLRGLQRDLNGLCEAVNDCIAAAGFEFDVQQQKRLMRVAAFGKSFCSMYESDVFVNMARRLRVLNTLRKSKSGMLISQEQLLALEGDRLAERLIQMNQHQLAYYVCETLGFSSRTVMSDWALVKITKPTITAAAEKEIAHEVVEKLRQCHQTNFADIAYKVFLKQRPHAALLILEAEKVAARQIPKLLDIKQPEIALRQAIKSGDADLLFTVMMHLIGNRGKSAVALFTSDPSAQSMLLLYIFACESHQDLLVEFFRNHPEYQTFMNILNYLKEEDRLTSSLIRQNSNWELLHESRMSAIQSAAISAKREMTVSSSNTGIVGSAFSTSAVVGAFPMYSSQPNEKMLRLHAQLLDEQTKFVKQFNDKRFIHASVLETITLCYERGQNKIAEKMKQDYGISEKMHIWSMLKAYAATSQWDLIDKIGASKSKSKPIIGAPAFIETLLACERLEQARTFIPKVPQIERRMEYYVICGDWAGAGADCRRNGEMELFSQLKERARGNNRAIQQIEEGWNSNHESGTVKIAKFFT